MPNGRRLVYLPALVLAVGCGLQLLAPSRSSLVLRAPLESLPAIMEGAQGVDAPLDEGERHLAGVTESVRRGYVRDGSEAFEVFVGYYASQGRKHILHSPKDCLPATGWEPLRVGLDTIDAAGRRLVVNRYLVARDGVQAMVFFWYQGRGHVVASEAAAKWQLMRDAVLTARTEEALVRVVVPMRRGTGEQGATRAGRAVVARLVPEVERILPAATS